MLFLAWLVLSVVAGVSLVLARLVGAANDSLGLACVYLAILVGTEVALLTIRLLKGTDQASATQAGMSGLMVLMMLCVGSLVGMRFASIITDTASITRWSPLLFLAGLVLVSAEAIRTIRRAPSGKVEQKSAN